MGLMASFIDSWSSILGGWRVICISRRGIGWLSLRLVRRGAWCCRIGGLVAGLVGPGFPQLFELPEGP